MSPSTNINDNPKWFDTKTVGSQLNCVKHFHSVDSRHDKPYFMGQWMYPPNPVLESLDASTETSIFSCFTVGESIHQLMKYDLSCQLSTNS